MPPTVDCSCGQMACSWKQGSCVKPWSPTSSNQNLPCAILFFLLFFARFPFEKKKKKGKGWDAEYGQGVTNTNQTKRRVWPLNKTGPKISTTHSTRKFLHWFNFDISRDTVGTPFTKRRACDALTSLTVWLNLNFENLFNVTNHAWCY